MKNAKNIVLVGFRGTGKGAIGRAIAKKLGMGFFDTDKEIERRERKRIPEIFSAVGEQGFRKIEKEIVAELASKNGVVIASGGGVVIEDSNIRSLKSNSVVILLRASPVEIYKRIRGDDGRPKLTDKGEFEEITYLLRERELQYVKAADVEFNTDFRSIEECAVTIIKKIREEGYIDG